jgi:ADP-heptose:LPS heptosyltransferase
VCVGEDHGGKIRVKSRRSFTFVKKAALKKILIIRFSSIGDIVLTTPVIRCIKQQLPDAEVHFAVKKAFYPVLKANPYIDHFHLLEDDLSGFTQKLKAEKFDFIVDLHQSLRSRKIRLSLAIPSRGFPKLNLQKWLLAKFKIDLIPDIHIVDRYFKAASPLGVVNDGKGLEYFIPAEDVYDFINLPEQFRAGYTAFVIGAKHATKRLPVHKIISICKKLDKPVILLGGPEDAVIAAKIEVACGPKALSLCGKLNLNQSASLVKQARHVISHDTGLMHVAAAFRKPLVSIWGNTVPQFGMYPYMPGSEEKSVILEVKGLKCRPCSKLGFDKCPKGHFRCMEEISEEVVSRQSSVISR